MAMVHAKPAILSLRELAPSLTDVKALQLAKGACTPAVLQRCNNEDPTALPEDRQTDEELAAKIAVSRWHASSVCDYTRKMCMTNEPPARLGWNGADEGQEAALEDIHVLCSNPVLVLLDARVPSLDPPILHDSARPILHRRTSKLRT